MKLKPVDSEMLVAAGYDEKSHSLQAVFRTGETYLYRNVPSFVYEGLMKADSIGRYMHKYILGRYEYERLTTTRSSRRRSRSRNISGR